MKHHNIPIFVPHMGCPHDCVFCSQNKITGSTEQITPKTVKAAIDSYLRYVKPLGFTEIAFFGGSFTGIPKEIRIPLLELANQYIKNGQADGIRLSTRPDYISDEIMKELCFYGVTSVELGVQSMDNDVLLKSGRGHSSKDVEKAVSVIKKYPVELGLQMMTGLPGDTFEKSVYTAERIRDFSPKTVRIYPTLVIKCTALEKMYNEGKYNPQTVDEAVELLARIIPIFREFDINIIRIGLQTTDEISRDGSVVAGPFHEAIGELAESRIFLRKLESELDGYVGKTARILCNKSDVSKIIGHKGCNRDRILNDKNIKLCLVPKDDVEKGYIKILR